MHKIKNLADGDLKVRNKKLSILKIIHRNVITFISFERLNSKIFENKK